MGQSKIAFGSLLDKWRPRQTERNGYDWKLLNFLLKAVSYLSPEFLMHRNVPDTVKIRKKIRKC